MDYISTRGNSPAVGFNEAVQTGLASDGGLYVPKKLPDLRDHIPKWEGLSYQELCLQVLPHFATDLDADILRETVEQSFTHFDHPEIAPLVNLEDGYSVLELFHGPTLAFKDFALQWLGALYGKQIARTGNEIAVLGATSGDTGAAAIHGLVGQEGASIFILYPDGRVSPLQERQMTCTGANNVYPLAIQGSFDDAQRSLKEVFSDHPFRKKVGLSAINSINLARILAQCVYYLYASLRIPKSRREKIRFVVPTGNFGNVLAGWWARKMGMPCAQFVVATNQNDILHRFFSTGKYCLGQVTPSLAPSMDIQVASNFERFLFAACNGDGGRVKGWMEEFASTGKIQLPPDLNDCFASTTSKDGEIVPIIRSVYERYSYICDPHTACGFATGVDSEFETIIMATAHPAKFPETIEKVLSIKVTHPSLEKLKQKEIVKYPMRGTTAEIKSFLLAAYKT